MTEVEKLKLLQDAANDILNHVVQVKTEFFTIGEAAMEGLEKILVRMNARQGLDDDIELYPHVTGVGYGLPKYNE